MARERRGDSVTSWTGMASLRYGMDAWNAVTRRRPYQKARHVMQVLLGATLIDGTGASPVPDAAVVIDGERIVAAGPRATVSWRPDASLVDLSGFTLLPGLIDTHDHLASHGYALTKRWGLDEPASTTHLRTA